MSFADAQIAIESCFATGFTACAVKYQNVDFDPEANDTYVELQVKDGSSRRASIGPDPLMRSLGIISVNVYTPKNTGTNAGRVLADKAAAVFRDQIFSGITCRSPVVRNVGPREGRYVTNMSVSFFRDDIF